MGNFRPCRNSFILKTTTNHFTIFWNKDPIVAPTCFRFFALLDHIISLLTGRSFFKDKISFKKNVLTWMETKLTILRASIKMKRPSTTCEPNHRLLKNRPLLHFLVSSMEAFYQFHWAYNSAVPPLFLTVRGFIGDPWHCRHSTENLFPAHSWNKRNAQKMQRFLTHNKFIMISDQNWWT